jgi:hypothetical protein
MNNIRVLKNGNEIVIRQLSVTHLGEILSLQRKVIATLATKTFLQPLNEEEFLLILNGKGLLFGAYHKNQLIAFRAMLEPKLDEEHLGKDAGIPQSEWPFVLYSEISNVHPDYRGNGLQLLLGELLLEEVEGKHFSYICSTVAPFNIASLKDKFVLGMHIVALKEKYGNLIRYIFMKKLAQTSAEVQVQEKCSIPMANTEEQQQLLQDRWIGVGIEKIDDQWFVHFEKRTNCEIATN